MIENYGLFNLHEDNDTLLVLFSDVSINKKENHGEVNVLFHGQDLIGYEIPNFIRFAKIKYSGILFLPSKVLIDVINAILENEKLEPLDYKKSSGYEIKTIDNKKVVYAIEGTFLRDRSISKGKTCTYFDLYIDNENVNDVIYIEEDIRDGTDFFQMEEK